MVSFLIAAYHLATVPSASSHRILLLVFASLVSTFVGAFVAYVVLEPLEKLNLSALAGHRCASSEDPEESAHTFLRALSEVTNGLQAAGAVFVSAESWKTLLVDLQTTLTSLEGQFRGTTEPLVRSATSLDQASARLGKAEESFAATARTLAANSVQFGQLCTAMQHPLASVETAGSALQKLADSAGNGLRGLAGLAEQLKQHIQQSAQALEKTLAVVRPVAGSLTVLARNQQEQKAQLEQLTGCFQKVGAELHTVAAGLAQQNQRQQAAQALVQADVQQLAADVGELQQQAGRANDWKGELDSHLHNLQQAQRANHQAQQQLLQQIKVMAATIRHDAYELGRAGRAPARSRFGWLRGWLGRGGTEHGTNGTGASTQATAPE